MADANLDRGTAVTVQAGLDSLSVDLPGPLSSENQCLYTLVRCCKTLCKIRVSIISGQGAY